MAQVPAGYAELKGSRRSAAGAERFADADRNESVLVTIMVRRRPDAPALPDLTGLHSGNRPPAMSREDYAAKYGALPEDLEKVAEFATGHGLQVGESSVAKRSVQVSGTVAQVEEAFGVDLGRYRSGDHEYRGREGAIHVPADLVDVVQGVFGLDNRQMAHPANRRSTSPADVVAPTTPQQVANLYGFPAASASGQTIGLLEFGGGYQNSDVATYFKNHGLTAPTLVSVSVDGHTNSYGGPGDNSTVEVNLDIAVAGAVAQGAKLAVYFAPWSEAGWVDVLHAAVHDATNKPSVLSISWGWAENNDFSGGAWSPAAMTAVDSAFQDAAMLGVTVFAASGDDGSSCQLSDHKAHVLYPTSDPYVTSCGGTTLNVTGSTFTETTWNDNGVTGGGISDVYGLPDYQDFAGAPKSINDGHVGRAVPDVAGNADPDSGYVLYIGGANDGPIGGTSAVAPLYAGLVARLNAILGEPVGMLQPNLYCFQNMGVYRDIHDGGSNATGGAPGYTSVAGYDCCTGLGSVSGTALLNAIQGLGRPPGLTVFNSELFMAWKGIERDDTQWYSTFSTSWAPQKQIPGVWSSCGPSLAVYDGKVFMVWKGMHFANVGIDDQRLWWTTFDGTTWAPQQEIPGVASSVGPSAAVYNGKLYLAWKGMLDDQGIWWTTYDGTSWAAQKEVSGVATSVGPSLAAFDGKLYMAWKGMSGDEGIWFSSFDGTSWAPQQNVAGVATTDVPSLAVYDGKLYMAWKGEAGDQRLWYSSYNGTSWAAQQEIPGVWSSVGPAIYPYGNKLYATWKGMNGDQRIWYTTFDGTTWAAQQVVPGVGTSPDLITQ